MPYMLLVLAAIFSTLGNLTLKMSKTENLAFLPEWLSHLRPLFFLAVVFYILNLLVFSKSLEFLPVNIAYPMLASLGFVFLAASSVFFLDETLSAAQMLGIAIILVGIFMLAGESSD